jgi:Spy/CpxP family protein refolding chaperone
MTLGDSPRKARLLGFALLVATFAIGAFAGAATDRVLTARAPAQAAREEGRERSRDRDRISTLEQLELTPEQRVRIDSVLERGRRKTQAFWDQHGPTLRAIVDSTRAEIRGLLTPEQRAEYDRLRAEHRRRSREQDQSGKGRDR